MYTNGFDKAAAYEIERRKDHIHSIAQSQSSHEYLGKRRQTTNRMKKLLISTMTTLLLVIILTSATFAAPAERELLLKGSWQAVETSQVVFPTIFVTGAGSGNATQLGLYTVSFQYQVNAPTGSGSGFIQFVAANGDTIFAAATGQSSPTGTPNVIMILEQHTITGGTGRFADATGTITVERVLDRTTGISSGTLNGTIILP